MPVLRLLSIAGSDSGGGAGVQADLKAFAALGVHGMSAITALTAQHTLGVVAIHNVPADFVRAEIRAVAGDIGVDAAKTGMLGDAELIEAVAEELAALRVPLVVDPVLVASSGARLLAPEAFEALVSRLLPLATVATPNLAEARTLTGEPVASAELLARRILELGPGAVVITGGDEDGVDWFCDGGDAVALGGERHASTATHGSGCTHSAALAVFLARGRSPLEAAREARRFAGQAVLNGLVSIGAGPGPVAAIALEER